MKDKIQGEKILSSWKRLLFILLILSIGQRQEKTYLNTGNVISPEGLNIKETSTSGLVRNSFFPSNSINLDEDLQNRNLEEDLNELTWLEYTNSKNPMPPFSPVNLPEWHEEFMNNPQPQVMLQLPDIVNPRHSQPFSTNSVDPMPPFSPVNLPEWHEEFMNNPQPQIMLQLPGGINPTVSSNPYANSSWCGRVFDFLNYING